MSPDPGSARPDRAPCGAPLLEDGHGHAVLRVEAGALRAANGPAHRLLGPVLAGAEVRTLFDPSCHEKLRAALAAERPSIWELQVLRPGGPEVCPILVVPEEGARLLVFLGDGAGPRVTEKLLGANDQLTEVARELSRRVRDLERTRDSLERLAELREQFTAALAHDVRAPLQAIQLAMSRLRLSPDQGPALAARTAGRVERSVERITRLTENVLTAARADLGGLPWRPRPVDLGLVAAEAAEALESAAEEAGVRIELAAPPEPARVQGDPVQLGQVVANLLGNAVRHAPRGTVVRVELSLTPALVRCAVRDEGPGIPAPLRESVFERFVQGERPGLAGLGLYVSRKLVELHRGRIAVEEAAGPGTLIAFELPRHPSPGG